MGYSKTVFRLDNELVSTDPNAMKFAEECLPHFQAILDIAKRLGIRRQSRLQVFLAFLAGDAIVNKCPRNIFKMHAMYAFDWAKKNSSRYQVKGKDKSQN